MTPSRASYTVLQMKRVVAHQSTSASLAFLPRLCLTGRHRSFLTMLQQSHLHYSRCCDVQMMHCMLPYASLLIQLLLLHVQPAITANDQHCPGEQSPNATLPFPQCDCNGGLIEWKCSAPFKRSGSPSQSRMIACSFPLSALAEHTVRCARARILTTRLAGCLCMRCVEPGS